MKKGLLKGVVLGVIFVVAIIFFSNMMNRDLMDNEEEVENPTMPVLYMQLSGTLVNPMYGNASELDPQYTRDSITPITTKRELSLAIEEKGNSIESVSYKVLGAETGEVIENSKLSGFTEEDGYLKVDFSLENRILMNQEYVLCFEVNYGGENPAYYYTRIVQRAGLNTSQYIEFVQDFYERCLSKETASGLTKYIEPDDVVTNNSFAKIDIHSSFDQLTWGSLSPSLKVKAVPIIKEINGTTCSISQYYEISSQDSDDNTEHYMVEEFYRMRYSQSRIMLLDFNRSAEQVFDGNLSVLTSAGINLGVVNPEVTYSSNQNGDIVAFEQCGELWTYNRSSNKTSCVFGFRSSENDNAENPDYRYDNTDHSIKVIRVKEAGDIDFVVYGYMNRGKHEGMTGVAVYRYLAERNVTEELAFIPCDKSAEYLSYDVEKLTYANEDNQLYLLVDGQIYHVDMDEKTSEILVANVSSDCLAVSSSQATIAWLDEMDANASENVTIMDLQSGETGKIQSGSNEKVRVLGFINEDLIYGLANDDDIVKDETGTTTFAMYKVLIQDLEGDVKKEYSKDNIWVTGVNLSDSMAELKCVEKKDGAYIETDREEIVNNVKSTENAVTTHLSTSERKGTTVAIDFSKSAQSSKLLVLQTKYIEPENDEVIELESAENDSTLYYIFSGGHLSDTKLSANQAVLEADTLSGVVLNSKQQYIWERGNKQDKELLTVTDLPDAVRDGILDEDKLQKKLGSDYEVLNLTGCTLDEVLYCVSQGHAVIALKPDGSTVNIVGYDSYNTILCDPGSDETYYYGINDSTSLFEEAGNVFISYIKNQSIRAADTRDKS